MLSYRAEEIRQDCDRVLAPFLCHADLPFANVLSGEEVDTAFADENAHFGSRRNAVYTAPLTLWGFLSQGVHKDKTCLAAALRIAVLLVVLSRTRGDTDSGSYCRARAKLPHVLLRRLAVQVGRRLERQTPDSWLWQGRHAMLVDGFTVLLPDTPDNQQQWPQHPRQKPGLGFPLMRLVVILSLITACVQDLAYGPFAGKETGETALFRTLLTTLVRGDVVVFDRYFGSYFMVALALRSGVDVVSRLNKRRSCDFRRGKRLAPNDHVVDWPRPVRPQWMTPEEYESFPETLTIREVRVHVSEPGFRVASLVVVTTLLDNNQYDCEDIADLYRERWQVELDIRSLKTSLQMEYLRCTTPFMVEKEIWSNVLSYNLLRKVAAQAARQHRRHPRQISFEATRKAVESSWNVLSEASPEKQLLLGRFLLKELAKKRVGNRPGRTEPRAVKRRPKQQRLLTTPRRQARANLLKGCGNDHSGSKGRNAPRHC
jgi:hypothetical protein